MNTLVALCLDLNSEQLTEVHVVVEYEIVNLGASNGNVVMVEVERHGLLDVIPLARKSNMRPVVDNNVVGLRL